MPTEEDDIDWSTPDHWDAERKFQATGDLRYVAVTIGLYHQHPPAWAIEACRAQCRRSIKSHRPHFVPKKRGVQNYQPDDDSLEKMAALKRKQDSVLS